jgi:hypothetical protein
MSSDSKIEEMNLQTDQFNSNAVKDELTHRLVHLYSDKKDIDELTHGSVRRLQIIGV